MGVGRWCGCAALILIWGEVRAGESWDGGSLINSNGSTAANWNPDGAPANNGTANILMLGPGRTNANLDVPWSINSLTFDTSALSFVLGGSQLTVGGGAIKNFSAV